jgi:hypothetical protein
MLPSYLTPDKFEKLQQSIKENDHLNNLKMVSLDLNFNEVLESQENWADRGHLSRAGGINYSEKLLNIISLE